MSAALLLRAKAGIKALEVENSALRAEKKLDRHEVFELKAALLAGTIECEDNIGILGGMFICTSQTPNQLCALYTSI